MTEWGQGCSALIKTWSWFAELCCSRIALLPCSIIFPVVAHLRLAQEDDAKFLEFSKIAEVEWVGFQKRFPKYP